MLFFKEGELVDAEFDHLSGLQALCVVFAQPTASFNFNPLIKPSRRTIDSSLQKAVSELLGCWDDSAIEVESIRREKQTFPSSSVSAHRRTFSRFENVPVIASEAKQILSLPPVPAKRRYSPSVMAVGAAGLLMLGASAFIGVSRAFIPSTSSEAAAERMSPPQGPTATSATPNIALPERLTKNRPERESNQRSAERKTAIAAGSSEAVATSDVAANPPSSEGAGQSEAAGDKREGSEHGGTVRVILNVQNGRVTQASIGNHKPGMEAYEALALRIARQRRYPVAASGQQTVMIKVD